MKLAKLFVPTIVFFMTHSALAADLILEDSFEQGRIDIGGVYNQSGNAAEISTDFARSGRYSMKSVLNRYKSQVSYRTEVTVNRPQNIQHGDELWYGFSIYLPADFVFSESWEVVAQWHHLPDDWEKPRVNQPIGLQIKQGKYKLFNLWDADPVAADGSFETDGAQYWDLGVPKLGEWTDWVFHIKWSYGDDGILEVWQDGKLVIQRFGPNSYNNRVAPYFKMGVYNGWRNRDFSDVVSERVIYHDELRIGGSNASYEDVAPGGNGFTNPRPPFILE